ncbi:Bug family tripartite tricarboxylate transporter substrate binding protein [Bordetella bronchiseptica]|uniref:Bug family tripartite tricarboxylate transporter substrate binding protein n=1 Tax=Bordetella bronchiseptica TaxID=518 RepID=UPI0004A0A3F9|nr:tripartite tricarboxylate transporter substrate binding protein [Bordetella bronchiseptica]KDC75274.1 tripartite tricarboxylate transporter family receptor [Bordetella bronchiseptica MBORD632]
MHRRTLLQGMLAGAAGIGLGLPARAAQYPDRALQWIVPYPPGGATDSVARAIATSMGEQLGQPVVIVNRPGGATNIGTEAAIRAAPDGYTLLLAVPPLVVNPALYPQLSYQPLRDTRAVGLVALNPNVLVVPADSPWRTPQQLFEAAQAKPDTITIGSPGIGTVPHLVSLLIGQELNVRVVPVPYKGSAALMPDLVSGRVNAAMDNLFAQVASVRSGRVRALATLGDKRSPLLPDVPSMTELGLSKLSGMGWIGMVAHSGTEPARIARLEQAVLRAAREPDIASRLEAMGLMVVPEGREAFQQRLSTEAELWQGTVRRAGVTAA